MARKVFISFLGTGNYANCKYEFSPDKISAPVRFVQEALINDLCVEWTEEDQILIFCTEASYQKNWVDNGHVDPTKPNQQLEEIEKIGLETRLRATSFYHLVKMVTIKEGFSEDEVWSIFDTVYEQLKEGDEVYFDVTHAFRSIPMFSTILFNYASFMKDVVIKSIHYGAFEKLGPSYIVKKEIPLEKRIAPLLNLTNMIRLQEYTDIASSFVSFGRVKKLSEVLKHESKEANSVVNDVCVALEKFDNALAVNQMSEIKDGKYMLVLSNTAKPLRKQNLSAPIKNIINVLHQQLQKFGFVANQSNQNIEAAISWVKHYKMLPQAYTLGLEYVITLLVEHYAETSPYKAKGKEGVKNFREYMSGICNISDEDIAEKKFKGKLQDNAELNQQYFEEELIKELRPYYQKLSQKRNSVNHAKKDANYKILEKEFEDLYGTCVSIIKKYSSMSQS
ncbi:MAG: TIGR02221 family CRISPR-associated protein [Bacteroidaceae bacterium]|nr:TIGR02221 family CRISPR-associated protein [Bacteroidaceae bacterium]